MTILFSKKTAKLLFKYLILLLVVSVTVTVLISNIKKVPNNSSHNITHIDIPINKLLYNGLSSLEQTKQFDRDVEYFMRYWDIKGGSFALMYNDSLIYAKGYGYANIKDSVECEVSHIFRVASISKLITATAIMKLYEQEKLGLNSQVFGEEGILNDSIFLNLKNKNLKRIKVEHLLRHTAGFSSPIGDPAFNPEGVARVLDKELPLSIDDMVIYATRNRLRSVPGGSYNYSNLGYIILSKIVEKVTNIEYEKYVKDSILAPIGCFDMHIGHNFSENREKNEVSYYEVKEAEPVSAYDGSEQLTMKSDGGNDVTLLSGAGGWVASPVELLKLVAAINNCSHKEDILKPESIRLMTQYSKRSKPIGWASVTSSGEWSRSGSMAGTSALIKKQKDGYTWVFISNSSSWNGPYLSKYMSSRITRAFNRVKEWPKRDMFEIEYFN